MRKFERIRVEKGEAYIRDTGIMVSEIIEKSYQGVPLADMLAAYPLIQADDILQALCYSLAHLSEQVVYWATDGLTPLTAIKGFSELLADKTPVPSHQLTPETQQQILATILHNSHRAETVWHNLTTFTKLAKGMGTGTWEVQKLSTIIDSIKFAVPRAEPSATVEVQVDNSATSIWTNWYIPQAIVNLIIDFRLNLSLAANVTIKHSNDEQIVFQVYRNYEHPGSHSDLEYYPENLFDSGPMAVSALIVRQHKSEIHVYPSETGITFEFSVPVWHENT
ncbi:MAG: DUF433 domain-containing protein [Anaerolineae bacterium]|nr:DUF433 domain-containing protein [Anaerolineae bacterium]